MLKILNRIVWFVQAVGLCVPPTDIPGVRKTVDMNHDPGPRAGSRLEPQGASMTVGRSGWIVLGIFLLGFALLLRTERSGDLLVRGFFWGAILLAIGYQTVNLFRGKGHHSTDMTAGLPASWRRWILGESGKP